jgi:plasmid stability protein
MASLNIRKLDDETHVRLRVRAAQHGRSMEEEARQLLREALAPPRRWGKAEWDALGERAKARQGGVRSDIDSTDLIREDRDA